MLFMAYSKTSIVSGEKGSKQEGENGSEQQEESIETRKLSIVDLIKQDAKGYYTMEQAINLIEEIKREVERYKCSDQKWNNSRSKHYLYKSPERTFWY